MMVATRRAYGYAEHQGSTELLVNHIMDEAVVDQGKAGGGLSAAPSSTSEALRNILRNIWMEFEAITKSIPLPTTNNPSQLQEHGLLENKKLLLVDCFERSIKSRLSPTHPFHLSRTQLHFAVLVYCCSCSRAHIGSGVYASLLQRLDSWFVDELRLWLEATSTCAGEQGDADAPLEDKMNWRNFIAENDMQGLRGYLVERGDLVRLFAENDMTRRTSNLSNAA
ncbi:unnamed protein product, partial [Amoebophrya sp. A25]|eukprot:GSA25T00008260001.1